MSGATQNHGLPYPLGSELPAGPVQMKALADATDKLLPIISASAPSVLLSGRLWFNPSTGLTQICDGTSWTTIGYTGPRRWNSGRAGTTDAFSSGSFVGLMSIILPGSAPAGSYAMSAVLDVYASATTSGNLRITAPNGVNLSNDKVINPITTSRTTINYGASFDWTGGSGTLQLSVQVNGGTGTVVNPGARLDLWYIGPTS